MVVLDGPGIRGWSRGVLGVHARRGPLTAISKSTIFSANVDISLLKQNVYSPVVRAVKTKSPCRSLVPSWTILPPGAVTEKSTSKEPPDWTCPDILNQFESNITIQWHSNWPVTALVYEPQSRMPPWRWPGQRRCRSMPSRWPQDGRSGR